MSKELYELLAEKLDRNTAEQILVYIDRAVLNGIDERMKHLVTKEDLANAKTDMMKWFVGMFVALALMIIGLYVKT